MEITTFTLKLIWLGHSAFLIICQALGISILTDPYEPGGFGNKVKYGKITDYADIVTVSHEHGDHNYTKGLKGQPVIIKSRGEQQVKGVKITGIKTYHDERQGKDRGENTVYVIEVDSIRICHLGDLGHILTEEQIKEIGRVDILLIPVGGVYTIDASKATKVVEQLNPKITIPMHYKTAKIGFDLDGVEKFTEGKSNVEKINGSEIKINKDRLPEKNTIFVLEPKN